MGFFSAVGQFFSRLFGLGEGALSNTSDKILSAGEGTIRAQYRKVRNQMLKNHTVVKNAVANLMAINEEKKQDNEALVKKIKDLETKKLGAVRKFKETSDEKYHDIFKELHAQLDKAKELLYQNNQFIDQNTNNIAQYKRQLISLQNKIDDLKNQEEQSVADIMTSRQVAKLNDLLSGISSDVDMQGIEAIEQARKKSLANAKLSTELSSSSKTELDDELFNAGSELDDDFARMLAVEENKLLDKPSSSADKKTDSSIERDL